MVFEDHFLRLIVTVHFQKNQYFKDLWYYKRWYIYREREGVSPLSNIYLDDAFTLKYLMGLEKRLLKIYSNRQYIFLLLFQVLHLR